MVDEKSGSRGGGGVGVGVMVRRPADDDGALERSR